MTTDILDFRRYDAASARDLRNVVEEIYTGYVDITALGTGIMGSAMAQNLVAAGLSTTVWDRSKQATAPLAAAGARVVALPSEAVQDAQVVITMLPTADAVESVIFGEGAAQALARGAAWAQMGTIGVTATTGIASRLGRPRPEVLFVDAPVSGSKGRPRPARLWGRDDGRLPRPVLRAAGGEIPSPTHPASRLLAWLSVLRPNKPFCGRTVLPRTVKIVVVCAPAAPTGWPAALGCLVSEPGPAGTSRSARWPRLPRGCRACSGRHGAGPRRSAG